MTPDDYVEEFEDPAPVVPRTFRTLPGEIQAIQWLGTEATKAAIIEFAGDRVEFPSALRLEHQLQLLTGPGGDSGWVFVPRGEWVATAPGSDDFWPIEPEDFEARFEAVPEPS